MSKRMNLLIACCFFITFTSCQPQHSGLSSKILNAFNGADFRFVGSGQVNHPEGEEFDTQIITHHEDYLLQIPERLEAKTQYVFHHFGAIETESQTFQRLEEYLTEIGMKLIEKSGSMQDLSTGSPLFKVRFSDGTHEGMIFVVTHLMYDHGFMEQDYVFVYTRG